MKISGAAKAHSTHSLKSQIHEPQRQIAISSATDDMNSNHCCGGGLIYTQFDAQSTCIGLGGPTESEERNLRIAITTQFHSPPGLYNYHTYMVCNLCTEHLLQTWLSRFKTHVFSKSGEILPKTRPRPNGHTPDSTISLIMQYESIFLICATSSGHVEFVRTESCFCVERSRWRMLNSWRTTGTVIRYGLGRSCSLSSLRCGTVALALALIVSRLLAICVGRAGMEVV